MTPTSQPASYDIAGSSDLTNVLMRELGSIPKNLQGWDFSLPGESLKRSIANFQASHPGTNNTFATLRGLETAFTAMIDDMLTAYGAAQFVIAEDSRSVPVTLHVPAIEFGQADYIYIIFTVNLVVVLLVGIQAFWTGLWHNLPNFDCLDPSTVILSSSKGGTGISDAAEDWDKKHVPVILDRRAADKLVLAVNHRSSDEATIALGSRYSSVLTNYHS